METLADIWRQNKSIIEGKTIGQVVAFGGQGKLNDACAQEFREFLHLIPNELLFEYIAQCFDKEHVFENRGFALQDMVNECGRRLGFDVRFGVYQGRRGKNGCDGVWNIGRNFHVVVEVKTTDGYRISLRTIAGYREQLLSAGEIEADNSSILIVVGRDDTGELEAQIRGSVYAWNIRLISVDALLSMLRLRETVNDTRVLLQIAEIFKPVEYTRLDKLVELIAIASEDTKPDLDELYEPILANEVDDVEMLRDEAMHTQAHAEPANFNQDCVDVVARKLGANFIRMSKIAYADPERSLAISCAVSKVYGKSSAKSYWFAFHDYQHEFLAHYETAYVVFGCGSPENILMIPFEIMRTWTDKMNKTRRNRRAYSHVVIFERDGRLFIRQPLSGRGKAIDVTEYKL